MGTTLKSDAITTGSGHSLNNLNVTINMVSSFGTFLLFHDLKMKKKRKKERTQKRGTGG